MKKISIKNDVRRGLEENIDKGVYDKTMTNKDITETSAVDTLKPMGAPGETKAQMLDTFVALLSQLGMEDLTKIFNQTLETIGQEAVNIPNDAAAKNAATIAAKVVKEDINELFSNDGELNEEFKEKISVLFESALNTRINLEVAKLEEEYNDKTIELAEAFENELNEKTEEIFESVTDKIDQYLDYVVTEWMEENKVGIESKLRNEISENFITGLHNLFAEHFITVPENKVDIVGELKEQVDSLTEKLNDVLNEKISLQNIIDEASKQAVVEELSTGMILTQAEKFKILSESVEYNDIDSYRKKLEIIKENFTEKKTTPSTGLIVEDATDGLVEDKVDLHMKKYVEVISKTVKK